VKNFSITLLAILSLVGAIPVMHAMEEGNTRLPKRARDARGCFLPKRAKTGDNKLPDRSRVDEKSVQVEPADIDPLMCLLYAVRDCDESEVASVLRRDFDINAPGADRKSALHLACDVDSEAMVELLLGHGARCDVTDDKGRSPLHLAKSGGIAKRLLDAGADRMLRDDYALLPIHRYAMCGYADALETLLDGAPVDYVGCTDDNGNTALHMASWEGHEDVARILLNAGASPAVRSTFEFENHSKITGVTPLHLAAACGHEPIVDLCLKADKSIINICDSFAGTALATASLQGKAQIVRLLLDAGAKHYQSSRGSTPLWCAVKGGYAEIVRLLLEHGEDVRRLLPRCLISPGKGALTILHMAAYNADSSVVSELLAHAAQRGLELSKMLDDARATPLSVALVRPDSSEEVVRLFARAEGVNKRVCERLNALQYAAHSLTPSNLLRVLLEEGADPELHEPTTQLPIDIALRRGRRDVAHLLAMWMASDGMKQPVVCPICFENFGDDKPSVLFPAGCRHLICAGCLDQLIAHGQQDGEEMIAKCPECRQEARIPLAPQ